MWIVFGCILLVFSGLAVSFRRWFVRLLGFRVSCSAVGGSFFCPLFFLPALRVYIFDF